MYSIEIQEYSWSVNNNHNYKKSDIIKDIIPLNEDGDHINHYTNKPYEFCVVHGHKTDFYETREEMYSNSATTPCIFTLEYACDYGLGCYQLDGTVYKRI